MVSIKHCVVVGAVVVLAAACGSPSDLSDSELSGLGRGEMEALIQATTEYQKGILLGGVDRREYEAAALDTEACIHDAGFSEWAIQLNSQVISIGSADDAGVGGGVFGEVPETVIVSQVATPDAAKSVKMR